MTGPMIVCLVVNLLTLAVSIRALVVSTRLHRRLRLWALELAQRSPDDH